MKDFEDFRVFLNENLDEFFRAELAVLTPELETANEPLKEQLITNRAVNQAYLRCYHAWLTDTE